MNGGSTERYTVVELRARTAQGGSHTDVARIMAMSDEDAERAIAGDPDWEGIPEGWYERAEAVAPKPSR